MTPASVRRFILFLTLVMTLSHCRVPLVWGRQVEAVVLRVLGAGRCVQPRKSGARICAWGRLRDGEVAVGEHTSAAEEFSLGTIAC